MRIDSAVTYTKNLCLFESTTEPPLSEQIEGQNCSDSEIFRLYNDHFSDMKFHLVEYRLRLIGKFFEYLWISYLLDR